MEDQKERLRRASQEAARRRTFAKHQRWAEEMRESGRWKVEEISEDQA
jgi:hypothetical protein